MGDPLMSKTVHQVLPCRNLLYNGQAGRELLYLRRSVSIAGQLEGYGPLMRSWGDGGVISLF